MTSSTRPSYSSTCLSNTAHQVSALSSISTGLFCSSCPLAKCRQLHFKNSVNRSSRPLNLIFVDVWGPSPYLSRDGFSYYISFVMIVVDILGFIHLLQKEMLPLLFFFFNPMLNTYSILKLKTFKVIGAVNFNP